LGLNNKNKGKGCIRGLDFWEKCVKCGERSRVVLNGRNKGKGCIVSFNFEDFVKGSDDLSF